MPNLTSKALLVTCATLALCVMAGCPFRVIFPTAMQTTSQDYEIDNSKIKITVVFNKAVDMSSLVAGTNVILVTEKDANADINITAGTTPADVVITSVDDYGDLLTFDPDGFFTLRLRGSGANPIESSDGDILDGDGDGAAGGDYQTSFALIG
ncbi:MAG: hypothetical protein ACE5I3_06305 [Phycisphaerae bacterium]